MTPKQYETWRPLFLQPLSLPTLTPVAAIVLILLSTPVHAADLQIEQPRLSGRSETTADVPDRASFSLTIPTLKRNRPLLATRSSCAVPPGRPVRQLRVGGVGGGYHGQPPASLGFEPEVAGQSIQQSIGQTLAQPPKIISEESRYKSKQKSTRKPSSKKPSSQAVKAPSQPAPKTKVPGRTKPTVYIVEMDDGQIYKGTMKPAGNSYIVSTKSGILTVKIKDIVRLKKAQPW